jgi:hypothetical protein
MLSIFKYCIIYIIDALQDLIAKSVVDVRKLAFGDDSEDAKTIPWSGIQFWKIMKELSKEESVLYQILLCFVVFSVNI